MHELQGPYHLDPYTHSREWQGVNQMSDREWLNDRLSMGVKLGLENCREILSRLGDPHLDFPSIHVAGTNGKGSLCVKLSAASSSSGDVTGLFTSPHLITVEERIRIDGRPISPESFNHLLDMVRKASEKAPEISPTYFETTFLVAMLSFSLSGVDRAIIETGMGGRLDATRMVNADLCILTTVSMDHSEFLGPTLADIAAEKAAIHRPGVPLIALQQSDRGVIKAIEDAAGNDLMWWPVDTSTPKKWDSYDSLVGAVAAYLNWDHSSSECIWPGRSPNFGKDWAEGVTTRLSAAHNAESIESDLSEVTAPTVILFGMTRKADLKSTLSPLVTEICMDRVFPKVIFTEPNSGRNPAVTVEELSEAMEQLGVGYVPTEAVKDPLKAFEIAGSMAREENLELLVIGSVYLIGDLLQYVVERDGLDLWEVLTAH